MVSLWQSCGCSNFREHSTVRIWPHFPQLEPAEPDLNHFQVQNPQPHCLCDCHPAPPSKSPRLTQPCCSPSFCCLPFFSSSFETRFCYVVYVWPEILVYVMLARNSWRSSCLSLPGAGIQVYITTAVTDFFWVGSSWPGRPQAHLRCYHVDGA